jgi:hypothetical protein
MHHPHSQRGKTEKVEEYLSDKKANWQGTPDKYPPVLVYNADQEEQHRAQGYYTLGTSSPEAFAQAAAIPPAPDYIPQQYPKWVGDKLVQSEEEERELTPVRRGRQKEPS